MQVAESTADLSDILGPVDDDDTGLGASPPRVAAPPQIQWTPFGERRKLYKPRYLGALENAGRDEAQGTSRGPRREGPPHLLPREAVRAERELLFAEKRGDAEREARYWHTREANGGWMAARTEGRVNERRGGVEQQLERPYSVRDTRRTLSAGSGGLYHGELDALPAGTRAGWADVHARQHGLYESRLPGTPPRRHTAGHARRASGSVRGHASQWSQSSASSGRSGDGSSGSRDVTVDRMEEDIKLTQDILAALSDRIGLNQTMLDKLLHKDDGHAQTPAVDLGKPAPRDVLLDQDLEPEQELEQKSAQQGSQQALGMETIATKSESPMHANTRLDTPQSAIKPGPEQFQWRANHNGSPSESQRKPGPGRLQDDVEPAALAKTPRAESQPGVRRRTIGPRTVSESDKAVQTEWSFPLASDDLPQAASSRQQRQAATTARRADNKARLAAIKTRLANTTSNTPRQPNAGLFTSALAWIVSPIKMALSLPLSALHAILAAISTCYYAVLSVFTNLWESTKRGLSAVTPQPAAVTRASKTAVVSLQHAVSTATSPFLRIATGKLIYASVLAALAALGWATYTLYVDEHTKILYRLDEGLELPRVMLFHRRDDFVPKWFSDGRYIYIDDPPRPRHLR